MVIATAGVDATEIEALQDTGDETDTASEIHIEELIAVLVTEADMKSEIDIPIKELAKDQIAVIARSLKKR